MPHLRARRPAPAEGVGPLQGGGVGVGTEGGAASAVTREKSKAKHPPRASRAALLQIRSALGRLGSPKRWD